jgi:MoxR-vWA-beta-propeller ternary system domain bpX6
VRASFRGTVPATAFLLDVGVIGPAEARRRILEIWRPGLDLRAVSADRWLVILPEPIEVRSEYAIGLPLVASNSGLAQPALASDPGTLVWLDAGAVRRAAIDALDPLPTEGWVDLAGHPVRRLTPLDRPEPTAVRPAEPEPPSEPDLRARVGIRAPRWRRRAAATGQPGAAAQRIRWGVVALIIVALLGIAGLIYALVGGSRHPQAAPTHSPTTQAATTVPSPSTPHTESSSEDGPVGVLPGPPPGSTPASHVPWLAVIFILVLGLGMGRRRRVRRVRVSAPAAARRRGWLARLVLHSPAQGVVRRRHERYLVSLTRKFERRDWDAALREAIALGGSGTGWLRLRLPRRRDSIGLRLRAGSGGSLYIGESAYAHLHAIYRRAAKQLDEAGQVDEAAFVYAELRATRLPRSRCWNVTGA